MKQLLILALMAATLASCKDRRTIVKSGLEGKAMPVFNILLADSVSSLNTKSIAMGKPAVFFFFQPWCPYCKAQTEEMIDDIQTLKGIHVYMVTTGSYHAFKAFYDHYQLAKYPGITAGIDTSNYFAGYFQTNVIPYLAIYGKDKRLKQVLMGKSSISLIKDIAL